MTRYIQVAALIATSIASLCVASTTLFGGTLVVDFSASESHLTTIMTVSGNFAGSFGRTTTPPRMIGPVVSCYVTSSSSVCTDINANYGVAKAASQVTVLVNSSWTSGSWTATIETPLSRLGVVPGTPTSMMFAYTGWVTSTSLPTKHASNAHNVSTIVISGPAPTTTTAQPTTAPGTGTASPATSVPTTTTVQPTTAPGTGTASPATSVPTTSTDLPASTSAPQTEPLTHTPSTNNVLSVRISVALGNLDALLSFNSTTFWGTMTIAGGYAGTIGVVSSGMEGSMVSCYGTSGSGAACVDIDGHQGYLTKPSQVFTSVVSATANATHAVISFAAPRTRFPSLAENCYIAYCWSPFDAAAGLPTQHDSSTDHGAPAVNFLTGEITEVTTPFSSRSQAYTIVGVVFGVLLVVAILLVRLGNIKLDPSHTVMLQLSFSLIVWGMVAVVVALANDDFEEGLTTKPVFRAFGEATAFVLSIILIPTTKHVGLGVIIGSSYERMLFIHPLLGFTLLVTMTVHMGGMFTTFRDPSDLFQEQENVFGFVAWIMMLCVVLPAMFIRRKSYNLFRVTHCIFILVLVFGVLHHEDLLVMLIPSFALWVIDLIIRIHSAVSSKAQLLDLHYNERAQILTLRLSVRWAAAPKPGSYVFLLVPSLSPVMHPFTVALAEEVDNHDRTRRVATFFIKNNGGSTFTAKLADYAKLSLAPDALSLSVFGPHGSLQVPVPDCDHVVMVCGGIGVTPMLSIFEYIATNIADLPKLRAMSFFWVARDASVFELFKGSIDGLAALCGTKVNVNVTFFNTTGSRILRMNLEEDLLGDRAVELLLDIANQSQTGDPRITSGRPDFEKLFSAINGDKIGCYVCGPPQLMASATKEASRQHFWVHSETFEF